MGLVTRQLEIRFSFGVLSLGLLAIWEAAFTSKTLFTSYLRTHRTVLGLHSARNYMRH